MQYFLKKQMNYILLYFKNIIQSRPSKSLYSGPESPFASSSLVVPSLYATMLLLTAFLVWTPSSASTCLLSSFKST
jgi:hypothetical protein